VLKEVKTVYNIDFGGRIAEVTLNGIVDAVG
jgi:hypothetical protein